MKGRGSLTKPLALPPPDAIIIITEIAKNDCGGCCSELGLFAQRDRAMRVNFEKLFYFCDIYGGVYFFLNSYKIKIRDLSKIVEFIFKTRAKLKT